MKMTKPTKTGDIKREWHIVDLKGKILGRAATEIATLLMGKSKPYFSRNMDCGDNVVVVNAKEIIVTGKKEKQKIYTNFSGYPGGLRSRRLEEVRASKPEEIIIHAVSGMLPHNGLHDKMLKRLFVFPGEKHNFEDKFNK